jgi:hypothetical protein
VGIFQINDRNFPVSEGTVYLKKGGQLKGNTWIRPYITYGKGHRISHYSLIEQVTMPWSEIDKRNIYDPEVYREMGPKLVDSVHMQLPLPYHLGDATTYVSYHNEVFLRRDVKKGEVAIYDLSEIDNHELSNYTDYIRTPRLLLLTSRNDTVKIYKGSLFREKWMKKKMVQFLNNRYQLDKKTSDFKDAGDIMEFIADEENNRLTAAPSH